MRREKGVAESGAARNGAAIACILASALGFALMAVFVRLADGCGGKPLPVIEKALFRNAVAAVLSGAVFFRHLRRGYAHALPRGAAQWSGLMFRCIAGTLGIFANFYAVSRIHVGNAMALNKTAPFFTVAISWIAMGEKMSLRQTLCVAGAFLGALLIVKPGLDGMASIDAAIGLAGGACAGAAYAMLHKLGRDGVDGAFIIFFFSVFSCLACLPQIAFAFAPMTSGQVLALAGAGAGAAAGQFGITWAYRLAEPRRIAVYDYAGIVFAAVFGFAVFGQVPDAAAAAGMLAIIAMGFLIR